MALSPLTLSITQGVQGREFVATISGKSDGSTIEVLKDGAPGFDVVKNLLMSQYLPYEQSTVSLRETAPGVGSLDTRISIDAASPASLRALALASLANGRTLIDWRAAATRASDGTLTWFIYAVDDLGATIPTQVSTPAPSPGPSPTPTPGPTPTPTPTPTQTVMASSTLANWTGSPAAQSDAYYGTGFKQRVAAKFQTQPGPVIDSATYSIGVGAGIDTGIARVEYQIGSDGAVVAVTDTSQDPASGKETFNIYPSCPGGMSGDAILWARVIPNAGQERLISIPITLDPFALIPRITLYMDPGNTTGAASDSNAGTSQAAPTRTLNGTFPKCTDGTKLYVVKMMSTGNHDGNTGTIPGHTREILVEPAAGLNYGDVSVTRSHRAINIGVLSIRAKNYRFKNIVFDASKIVQIVSADVDGFQTFDHCGLIDSNGILGPKVVTAAFPAGHPVGYGVPGLPDTTTQSFFGITTVGARQTTSLINGTRIENYVTCAAQLYRSVTSSCAADINVWATKSNAIFGWRAEQPAEFYQRKSAEQTVTLASQPTFDGTRSTITPAPYAGAGTIGVTNGNANAVFSAAPLLGSYHRIRITSGPNSGRNLWVTSNSLLYNSATLPTTIAMSKSLFSATVSGNVMTVTAVYGATTLSVGDTVAGNGNIPGGTTIASLGTGTGGTGTYILSAAATPNNITSATLLTSPVDNLTTSSGDTYEVFPLLSAIPNGGQPNQSVKFLSGAAVGLGSDDGFPTYSQDIGTGLMIVTGDARAAQAGDIAFTYIIFHADTGQHLGLLTTDPNVENFYWDGFEAPTLSAQGILTQTFNGTNPAGGTISTSGTSYTIAGSSATVLPGNFIQLSSGAANLLYDYRRSLTGGLTGTLESAFAADVPAGTTWRNAKSIKDFWAQNCVLSVTQIGPYLSQFQNGHQNFNIVCSDILGGDPATLNSSGGKLSFRSNNGGGFGVEDFYVRDCIITDVTADTGPGMPSHGVTMDNNHCLFTPPSAGAPANVSAGSNVTYGAVDGLTDARNWQPLNWGSRRKISGVRVKRDLWGNLRKAGDPVGAVVGAKAA